MFYYLFSFHLQIKVFIGKGKPEIEKILQVSEPAMIFHDLVVLDHHFYPRLQPPTHNRFSATYIIPLIKTRTRGEDKRSQ